MKNLIAVVCVLLLVAGCSGQTIEMTWDDVYKMVDEGAYQSKIDQAIFDIGPETHPASIVLVEYYNFCFNNEYEQAWELIESDSPFMTEKGNLDDFSVGWTEGLKTNNYENLTIEGLDIEKKVAETRSIEVIFSVDIIHNATSKTYTSKGIFKMSKSSGEWRIFSNNPAVR